MRSIISLQSQPRDIRGLGILALQWRLFQAPVQAESTSQHTEGGGSRKASTSPSLQAGPEGNTTTEFPAAPHCSSQLTFAISCFLSWEASAYLHHSFKVRLQCLRKLLCQNLFLEEEFWILERNFLKSLVSKADGEEEGSDYKAELLMFEQLTTAHLQCLLLGF